MDITFLAGERVPRCTHQINKYFPDYSTLQLMTRGIVNLKVDEQNWVLNGRWFWSAYPGPRVRFEPGQTHWSHRYIAFRGDRVLRWMEQKLFPIQPQKIEKSIEKGADFSDRFDRLLTCALDGRRYTTLRAANILESILIDLAEARGQIEAPSEWLQKVIHRLDQSTTFNTPDYDELAAESGKSARALRRGFRKQTGLSPHQYLLHQRLNQARKLLGTTDLSIKEIAKKMGYSDVFYFSRQFVKIIGVSPGAFRRSRES